MRGFNHSYNHRPGDHFIFKGGVTWPNSVFPLVAAGSGRYGANDYYGVDPGWYSGARFTLPVFSAGGREITAPDAYSVGGPADIFLDLRYQDYITVDDIAFQGWTATRSLPYGQCAVININSQGRRGDQNITITRVNVSRFSIKSDRFGCAAVMAYTGIPYAGNSVVANSAFSGDGNTFGTALSCVGNARNNVISRMVGMIYPCGHGTISGNRLYDCGYPAFPAGATGVHADAIQSNGSDGGKFYIHDNVIYNTGAAGSNECEPMFIGTAGETDYVWNNVVFNPSGNSLNVDEVTAGTPPAAYYWNNTVLGGAGGTGWCLRAGHHGAPDRVIVFENNLCITSRRPAGTDGVDTTGDGASLSAGRLTIDHNLVLTPSQAATDGYTAAGAYAYSPVRGRSPTARAGVNLTSQCKGSITLCVDTTYAKARHPRRRPGPGPWDIGAYQQAGK